MQEPKTFHHYSNHNNMATCQLLFSHLFQTFRCLCNRRNRHFPSRIFWHFFSGQVMCPLFRWEQSHFYVSVWLAKAVTGFHLLKSFKIKPWWCLKVTFFKSHFLFQESCFMCLFPDATNRSYTAVHCCAHMLFWAWANRQYWQSIPEYSS